MTKIQQLEKRLN